jgi:hypothetical protein
MSDLKELLAGAKPQEDTAPDEKKKSHPKPAWVAHREEVTGIDAQYNESERRWVFPGLSSNMGGPKKGAQTSQALQAEKPKADPDVAARSAFASGDYKTVVDLLSKDPDAAKDPKKKALLDVAMQAVKG